jgi:transposase-like protein
MKNTERQCPHCGERQGQHKRGTTEAGTQRFYCSHCKKFYSVNPKVRAYSEEKRQEAIKLFYAGASGRKIGNLLGMSKANVYNWLKKTP